MGRSGGVGAFFMVELCLFFLALDRLYQKKIVAATVIVLYGATDVTRDAVCGTMLACFPDIDLFWRRGRLRERS